MTCFFVTLHFFRTFANVVQNTALLCLSLIVTIDYKHGKIMKAFVFPGQGAQFSGMGKDLYESNPLAKIKSDNSDDDT